MSVNCNSVQNIFFFITHPKRQNLPCVLTERGLPMDPECSLFKFSHCHHAAAQLQRKNVTETDTQSGRKRSTHHSTHGDSELHWVIRQIKLLIASSFFFFFFKSRGTPFSILTETLRPVWRKMRAQTEGRVRVDGCVGIKRLQTSFVVFFFFRL